MISKNQRQWMVLAALLLFGVVIVTYQLRGTEPQATTAQAPTNPVVRGAAGARREVPMLEVKLDALKRGEETEPVSNRNPFRFKPKPPPPPPPQVARANQVPAGPPVPTGPPPPPPIPLRFIGVIEGQTRVGVLSDGRGNVFYGKDGDIIDGRYRVLRVGADSADLSYTDGRGRQTLRLSGQ